MNAIVNQMPVTIGTYPDFMDEVRGLVQQHRKLKKQQLRLAVYFAPPNRPKRDIYLFEVIEGFGGNTVDPGEALFRFAYGSTPGLPLPGGATLQMVLTNPVELEEAIRAGWKEMNELRLARKADKAMVIYAAAKGKKLWNKIR